MFYRIKKKVFIYSDYWGTQDINYDGNIESCIRLYENGATLDLFKILIHQTNYNTLCTFKNGNTDFFKKKTKNQAHLSTSSILKVIVRRA